MPPRPLDCIAGKGCSPVIDMSQQFGTFMATAQQSMTDHAVQSQKFWDVQKEQVGEIVLQINECLESAGKAALKFNDGSHRMNKLEGDIDALAGRQRYHESDEYGAHANIKRQFAWHRKGIIVALGGVALVGVFVMIVHPEFLAVIGNLVGIK